MILKLEVGMLETNCYIFIDDETNKSMIIDPGENVALILDTISEKKADVEFIVLTHGHWDHIGVLDRIKAHTEAKVLIHEADKECLFDSKKSLAYMFGINGPGIEPDRLILDGEKIVVGKTTFKVLHTPGHTKGSICLLTEGILFSGDTLFQGTVGRTDLPGGSSVELEASIKGKLLALDDEIKVLPGHGAQTTIGKEKVFF